ncbi:MAG: DUF2188 domain-containing protein [Caulobacterales bacterium]
MSQKTPTREVYTVTTHQGGWAVEHEGALLDASTSKEEVMASASRRARAANQAGRPAQVSVRGEAGFFGGGR